jgi:copper(I)-binding protein
LAQDRSAISESDDDGLPDRKEIRLNLARLRHCAIAASALFALAACHQQNPTQPETNPDSKPGITVTAGVLRLPAVKGNPGAAYFIVTNGSRSPVTLGAVHVDGAAKAEMHETKGGSMNAVKELALTPGETVNFEPGGKLVMLFGLDPKLKAGGKTEMTLVFADGDKASTRLKIEVIGGGMADMPGMDHAH